VIADVLTFFFYSLGEVKESISEMGALMKQMCLKLHRIRWITLSTVLKPVLDKNDLALIELNTAYTYLSLCHHSDFSY
jgi:hypothetical protein